MTRDELAEALRQVLPVPTAKRELFISAAIEHVDGFREAMMLVRNRRDIDGQMERLEAASKKFAQAIAAVSDDGWDFIEQDIITDFNRDRPRAWTKAAERREGEQATRAGNLAALVVATMRSAGATAERLFDAAALRRSRLASETRIASDAAFKSLVRLLIQSHIGAYECRPAYSHGGYFFRALQVLIDRLQLPRKVDGAVALPSEEWMRDLVSEVAGPDVPPPKRGPKQLH